MTRKDKAFSFVEDMFATRTAKEAHKVFSKTGNIMSVKNKFGMHGLNKAISKDTGKRMAFNIGWVRDLKKHKKTLLNKIENKGGTVRQIQSKGNDSDNKIKQMSKPMGDKYRKTIASLRKYNKGE